MKETMKCPFRTDERLELKDCYGKACTSYEEEQKEGNTTMPTKPKIWVKKDIPTPGEMEIYLARIRATRELFPAVSGFPPLPESMSRLTFEGANNIEEALLRADELIEGIQKSRVYSGELQAGGV